VVGSAEGQKRRPGRRRGWPQTGTYGWVGVQQLEPMRKLEDCQGEGSSSHVGVLTGDDVPGGFWAVTTARTDVVVPFAMLKHHMTNG